MEQNFDAAGVLGSFLGVLGRSRASWGAFLGVFLDAFGCVLGGCKSFLNCSWGLSEAFLGRSLDGSWELLASGLWA